MTAMAAPLWTMPDLLAASGARADGVTVGGVDGVSIDTRTIAAGDLFVALEDQRDGHDFVGAAFARGAAAALVKDSYARRPGDGLLLRVGDPLCALEAIGRAGRARLAANARVIAVTGSAGKTTTKEMLRTCCARLGATHASEKSYNNQWGVPLTLARMPAATRFAIFEIGMNHAGEITPLTRMVWPHVAVITTVVAAHLEHFGTEEAIADAKAEILLGLEPGGTAVLNAGNRHIARLISAARARPGVALVTFNGRPDQAEGATRDGSNVWLAKAHPHGDRTLVHAGTSRGDTGYHFEVGAVGDHMVVNALAVIAALEATGADAADALKALKTFGVPQGRGARSVIEVAGGTALLIDESYNANPASMRAALETMALVPRDSYPRRIAVLGEMLELGADAPRLHVSLKEAIDAAGVDLVFAAGSNMRLLYDQLPQSRRGAWADAASGIRDALLAEVRDGDVVMVKGSNGSRTWALVDDLKKNGAGLPAGA